MTPPQFWKCTPRKFNALCAVHADLNTPEEKSKTPKEKKNPDGSVGEPDTFIDKVF